jgi:allantoin racemase
VVPGGGVVHPPGELHEDKNGSQRSLLFRVRYGTDVSVFIKAWRDHPSWRRRPEDRALFGLPAALQAPAGLREVRVQTGGARMKLLVANANTTEAITALCAATARAAAAPGTEIIPATPRFGPAVISTRAENVVAGHALLECLAEHAGQVDAVLLAVSHDTALEAARSLLACPVVGMTEAACLTACLLGGRFGLVTMGMTEPYRERIAQYGLTERLAGLGAIAMTPPEALADPEGAAAQLRAAIAELAGRGADAVVLGGAALAGMLPRVQPGAPVPLLDGIACGVKLAEALVALRLPKPQQGSYAPPRGRASGGLGPALTDLLRG